MSSDSDTPVGALELLEQALALIDQSDAPAHIGAHLDLALCQLREHLDDKFAQQASIADPTAGR
jgi:hypothetical protein